MPLTYCPGCHATVRRLLVASPGMLCPSCLERGDHVSLLPAPPDPRRSPAPSRLGPLRLGPSRSGATARS